jgi:hypothetical protein
MYCNLVCEQKIKIDPFAIIHPQKVENAKFLSTPLPRWSVVGSGVAVL